MLNSTEIARAEALASSDWNSEKISFLIYGDLYAREPVIHPSGFYLAMSWDDQAFISSYNKRVADLVQEHGLPEWAPGVRVFSDAELPLLVSKGRSFSEYEPMSDCERKLVRRHLRIWNDQMAVQPSVYFQSAEREIVLLGGIANNLTRVDQLDIRGNTWMAKSTFEDLLIQPAAD